MCPGCHVGAMCSAELSTCIVSGQGVFNNTLVFGTNGSHVGGESLRTRADVWLQLRLFASMYTTKTTARRTAKLLMTAMILRLLFNSQFVHREERTEVM